MKGQWCKNIGKDISLLLLLIQQMKRFRNLAQCIFNVLKYSLYPLSYATEGERGTLLVSYRLHVIFYLVYCPLNQKNLY